ncbi:MAG: antibiotic biosynthesis monooxygenase [Deltaproteobacteria bacterium]|nr:antibiotic biosynthesis monooxygenase [Deltaproteobacteria bacterium]
MIKTVINQYKTDEFVESMLPLLSKLRKEKHCVGYNLYRDSEKENVYAVVGKWNTRKAMEQHFQTQNFEVLIGAARVLGETLEMNIAEVSETGGFELARKHIAPQQRKSETTD